MSGLRRGGGGSFLAACLVLLFLRFIIYAESGEESAGQMGKRGKGKGPGVRIHEELRVSGHAAE